MKRRRSFTRVVIITIALSISQHLNAQSWSGVEGGVNDDHFYVLFNGVNALYPFNGNLYVGGGFDTAGTNGINHIAIWNGFNWDSLQHGVSGIFVSQLTGVNSIINYKNNIYVGGPFDTAGVDSANNIACWNGSKWNELQKGVESDVSALFVFDSSLYVGGELFEANGIVENGIAKWDGTSWSPVGGGLESSQFYPAEILSFANYNDQLIVGGLFDTAGGVIAKDIAAWNGTSWSAFGNGIGINNHNYEIDCLLNYNGNLYVGGYFDSIGGIAARNIAMWSGSVWLPLGQGVNQQVRAITVYNGNLIVGGNFDTAGVVAASCIGKWDGSKWSALGNGLKVNEYKFYPFVNCLAVYNGSLYAGGVFDTAGGVPAKNIAMWSEPAGINQLSVSSNQLSIYPNPTSNQLAISSAQPIKAIDITNLIGQEVYKSPSGDLEMMRQTLDVSALPDGLYFVAVKTDTGVVTKKFIVNK